MEKKKNMLFEFLKDVCYKKEGTLLNESTEAEWSTFMILRFLSMEESLVPIVELVEPYQSILSKMQMYQLLLAIIPPRKRFLTYIRDHKQNADNELVMRLQDTYGVSIWEAAEYAHLLTTEEQQSFMAAFGGLQK